MFILAGSPPIVDYSVDTEITQAVSGLSHYVTEAGPRPVIKIDIPLQRRNLEVSLAKMEAASRAEAIQQILEIEKLEANWDGYGAEPVCHACVTNAKAIIDSLPLYADLPDVFPNPNGTITLEWESASGTLSIEIGENGMSGFFDADGHVSYYQEAYAGGLPAFAESALEQMYSNSSAGYVGISSVMEGYAGYGTLTSRRF